MVRYKWWGCGAGVCGRGGRMGGGDTEAGSSKKVYEGSVGSVHANRAV